MTIFLNEKILTVFHGIASTHIKDTLAQVFPCEFCEIFKNTLFNKKATVAASFCCLLKIFLRFLNLYNLSINPEIDLKFSLPY